MPEDQAQKTLSMVEKTNDENDKFLYSNSNIESKRTDLE